MNKSIFRRYLSVKVLPIWIILVIDVLIVVVSCLTAYFVRYDFMSTFNSASQVGPTICWMVGINLIFFRLFRTYSNVLRFSSFIDIMRIFLSLSVSYAVLLMIDFLTTACCNY